MRLNRKGYTLIELVVVVLIVGILASFGIPQYLKTVETSKADDAVSIINMIGTTNKMFALDHSGVYAVGQFTAACGAGTCVAPWTACDLVYCKYLADQDWATRPYDYYACNGAVAGACATLGGGNNVSGAKRKATASSPYNTWGFVMNTSGQITAYGTTPPTPTY
ncbi:MAG: prepilin-type N-terminal cleavage/methylation domain-containing protein [Elusimicrobiota bacterium]|nr:prepilin-type N-terminal cleavage/methylation domain-containing protein [Elusimicrobiota bacterium]